MSVSVWTKKWSENSTTIFMKIILFQDDLWIAVSSSCTAHKDGLTWLTTCPRWKDFYLQLNIMNDTLGIWNAHLFTDEV